MSIIVENIPQLHASLVRVGYVKVEQLYPRYEHMCAGMGVWWYHVGTQCKHTCTQTHTCTHTYTPTHPQHTSKCSKVDHIKACSFISSTCATHSQTHILSCLQVYRNSTSPLSGRRSLPTVQPIEVCMAIVGGQVPHTAIHNRSVEQKHNVRDSYCAKSTDGWNITSSTVGSSLWVWMLVHRG